MIVDISSSSHVSLGFFIYSVNTAMIVKSLLRDFRILVSIEKTGGVARQRRGDR